jgi:hypothetical protein
MSAYPPLQIFLRLGFPETWASFISREISTDWPGVDKMRKMVSFEA